MPVESTDPGRAALALRELSMISGLRGSGDEARRFSDLLASNLSAGRLSMERLGEESPYQNKLGDPRSWLSPQFRGYLRLAWLGNAAKSTALLNFAVNALATLFIDVEANDQRDPIWSCREAGNQLAYLGLFAEADVFLEHRIKLIRSQMPDQVIFDLAWALFDRIFILERIQKGSGFSTHLSELRNLVEQNPALFDGAGKITLMIRRLLIETKGWEDDLRQ